MKDLKKILLPLKNKLFLEIFIKYLILFGLYAAFAAFILLVISRFIFVYNVFFNCICIFFVAFLSSVIVAFIKKPDYKKAAHAGDSLGYKQRLVTALELIEEKKNDVYAELAIDDTIKSCKDERLNKKYKLKISKKALIMFGIMVLLIFIVGFAPPKEFEGIKVIEQQINKIESEKEKLKENKNLNKEDLKEINNEISELIKNIKKSEKNSEAVDAIRKSQSELKKLEKKSMDKDLKSLSDELKKNEVTKSMSDAINNMDLKELADAIKEVAEKIENMSESELQDFINSLNEMAEQLSENPELQELLNQLADKLSNSDMDISDDMKKINDIIDSLMKKNQDFANSIKKINNSLSQAAQNLQPSSSKNQSQSEGNGENGEGQGNGEGEGQGNGEGEGQGNGNEKNEKSQEQSNGKGGNGRGTGHAEPDRVYTRNAEDMGGQNVNIDGQLTDNGDSTNSQIKTIGQDGESVPYTDVVGEYKNKALNELENEDIPYGMREIVTQYFSDLN